MQLNSLHEDILHALKRRGDLNTRQLSRSLALYRYAGKLIHELRRHGFVRTYQNAHPKPGWGSSNMVSLTEAGWEWVKAND